MENEQTPTPTSYTVPTISESLSPEEADTIIKEMQGAMIADKNHPLNKTIHPQRKAFMAAKTRLFEIKNPEPEKQTNENGEELIQSGQFSPEVIAAMEEGIELKENRNAEIQAKRTEQAEKDMDALVELDYERDSIPENISQRQVDILRMQRLNAEGDILSLTPMLTAQLRGLHQPPEIQQLFETFCTSTEFDTELRKTITEKIIGWINETRKAVE